MKRPFDRGAVRLARHVSRALQLRCPVCGGGSLFTRWVHMKPVCPRCGLRTDRGEADYFIGGYTVNFVTAELAAAVGMLIVVVATWPTVPWRGLMWGGVALMVALPIAFYPYSRTLWLAIDLTFRSPHEGDFTARPGRPRHLPGGKVRLRNDLGCSCGYRHRSAMGSGTGPRSRPPVRL